MSRVMLAVRAFWRVLMGRISSERATLLLENESEGQSSDSQKPTLSFEGKRTTPAASARSDALTLLATLQREARFVDLVMEPLDGHSDAQVGAAARDVLRQCRTTLDRTFDLQPLMSQSEGESVETDAKADASHYRLVGRVQGNPPYRGKLMHHGWKAMRCEVPQWTGSEAARFVVAPAEVECQL